MSENMIDDDYEKIMREIVFEEAAKAIKEDPTSWIKQLEDIGIEYFDDGYGDEEELERFLETAKVAPMTDRKKKELVRRLADRMKS